MRVYLSGPIAHLRPAQASAWRSHAREMLEPAGIEVRDPLRGTENLHDPRRKIRPGEFEVPELSDIALFERDHMDVTTSDVVLMNLLDAELVTIGSMIELGWITANAKMLIVVMEEKGNVHDHPLVRARAIRFDDLDRALEYVMSCADAVGGEAVNAGP